VFSNIEKFQKKPEHIKRRIVLVVTLVLFLAIIAIWLSVGNIEHPKQKHENQIKSALSPFDNFKNIFMDIKDDAAVKLDLFKKQNFFNADIFK